MLFIVMLTLLGMNYPAFAIEIIVDPNGATRTVGAALAQSRDGDVVTIRPGTYNEQNLVIDKSITLRGQSALHGQSALSGGSATSGGSGAIIDARQVKGSIIIVKADNVTITGLTLRNVGVSYVDDNAAIKVLRKRNITIEHCTIDNGFFAIYLERCVDVRVRFNRIISENQEQANSGNGVHAWTCRNVLVEGNTIKGHRDGVYFEFMKQGTVLRNHSEGNLRYGLHFMFSDSCSYRDNLFYRNGAGVAVMYTKHIEMLNNEFRENWGSAAYGLLLKEITDSHLRGNRFIGNSVGIHAEGASRCFVEQSVFRGNGYGVRLMGNCSGDRFEKNIFDGNSFDVSTNTAYSENVFDGNYWSEYGGYDLDRDGTGDVPHHPVRLYSMLVEQVPSSVILMHSLFINILDLAERIVPSVTPLTLTDMRPSMRPPFREASHRP